MIIEDTLITVNSDGAERRIQDLCIADRVFDPISGRTDEVIDILARRIWMQTSSTMRPMTLAVDALAPGRPRNTVAMSPSQVVMVPMASAEGGWRKHVVENLVSSMPQAVCGTSGCFLYFAVFFERPRYLDVSGIITRAYTLEDTVNVQI
jgi:hypothetical protein